MQIGVVLAVAAVTAGVQMAAPDIDPAAPVASSVAAPVVSAQPPAPAADPGLLPALTPVSLEIMATINSEANHIGEHFPIRLSRPLVLADGSVIPAGITGSGDIVHAAKSRFAGKPGELILAARYLDYGATRIPLRSLTFPVSRRGLDNTDTAAAVAIAAGLLSVFITGGEVNIPAGTPALAKTSAAVRLPPPSTSATASTPSERTDR